MGNITDIGKYTFIAEDNNRYLKPNIPLIIDNRKFTEYLLNYESDRGRHKAQLFKSVLGINLNNYDSLLQLIKTEVYNFPVHKMTEDTFGQRLNIRIPMQGKKGEVKLLTCWIENTGNSLRLTTAYPLIKGGGKDDRFI